MKTALLPPRHSIFGYYFARALGLAVTLQMSFAQEPAGTSIILTSPLNWQVVQRRTFRDGVVNVTGKCVLDCDRLQMRVAEGRTRAGEAHHTAWVPVAWNTVSKDFAATLELPAGGWYAIEVQAMKLDAVVGKQRVEHVGMGEVFVVAGQSNSANYGEERQASKTGQVATFDIDHNRWQPANDPQPGASGGGGSFLPPLGDALAERFRVPVGFISCGIGATSVREWLPKGTTFPSPPTIENHVTQITDGTWASNGGAYEMLAGRMKKLGPNGFRAVLWHQGESDVNQPDPKRTLSGELYVEYLKKIIVDSRKEIGWNAPWFVALVTYHTPAYTSSPEMRAAQRSLWKDGVVLEGPDSDALKGDLREANGQGVHFSGKGLREHGARWADKIGTWLAAMENPQ